MNLRCAFLLPFLLTSLYGLSQPYSGTIFVDPDIITATDSSAFVESTYIGRGTKTIFDRRVDNWIQINAFLFNVVWNDDLSTVAVVNPEFGTEAAAAMQAEKYGRSIGQIPHVLRVDIDELWINKGVELFGGGNRSILIHTGQTALYERDGILEETLVHEATHTSLDAAHERSPGWLTAQQSDGGFISTYARDNPLREDVAESYLMWLAVRYRAGKITPEDKNKITQAIPNRLQYFDNLNSNLFPLILSRTTSMRGYVDTASDISAYPNPTADFLYVELEDPGAYQVILYNTFGTVVHQASWTTSRSLDLSQLSTGVYILQLRKDDKLLRKKIMKY